MQPKAAVAPEPAQANSRPSNTYAQRPQQGFAPPPAHQQKLMLCRYFEAGKLLCADQSLASTHTICHIVEIQNSTLFQPLSVLQKLWVLFVGKCERGSACWFAHGRDELRHPHKHASRQEVICNFLSHFTLS